MRNLIRLIGRFRRDRRGNIAVIFTLALLPILSAVGSAIDYTVATRMKAKLQSAADAASIASISQNSPGFMAASVMTSDGSVAVAVTDANNIFNGNVKNNTGNVVPSVTSTVTKTGAKLASNVQFTADVPTAFMKVLGFQKLTVAGVSKSSSSLPLYLDFYLMLDVSGSMGLPSTNAEQTRLAAVNPDNFGQYPNGCTLACHFDTTDTCGDNNQKYPTANYCLGYPISRISQAGYNKLLQNNGGQLPAYRIQNLPSSLYPYNPAYPKDPALPPVTSCSVDGTDGCIQLRADAVGYAVNQLLKTAPAYEKVANQFRVGLYPFIQDLYAYFALTSSINGDPSNSSTINYAAANLASQLDTNRNSSLGSGGTHIDTAFNTLNGLITSVGNGSSSNNTLPYVFLVTDGAQDPQMKGVPFGGWSGSNHAVTLGDASNTFPTICATLKNRGIIVSVLNVPYQPINPVNKNFANDEDDAANNNINGPPGPGIKKSLQNCASPPDAGGSYYYEGNTPDEINTALQAMFNHSIQTAHITN